MSNKTKSIDTSLKLDMILFLIFMTLKLMGYIDWSWWWVTSPLWISGLLVLSVVALAFFVKSRES